MGIGLMAHTLYEDRDLNSADDLFEKAAQLKTDPEMVDLAMQLIERQSGKYDPADLEDHCEVRLRALIDAKLAGGGLVTEPERPIERGNVIDLVAALKRSLAQAQTVNEQPKPAKVRKEPDRRQTGLKLPIAGGKSKVAEPEAQPVPSRTKRKA
jgi:DNA end-binding protein Ku